MGKKIGVLIVIIVVAIALGAGACKGNDDNKIPEVEKVWEDMPNNTNPNLKWMGFWGSDYDWREGEDAVALDKLIATNTTNIDFICGWTPENVQRSVEKSVKANRKVFLRWHLGFAGYDASDLEPKYKEFIDGYGDYVYGFYIDEPHWNRISMEEFTAKTKFIRESYPGKELLVVMAVAEFSQNASTLVAGFNKDGQFQSEVAPEGYYDYCTLLGFDFYTTLGFYDNYEETDSVYKILHSAYVDWFITDLCALRKPHQKLWFCAKGFWVAPSDPSFNNTPLENRTEGLEPGDDIIDILKWHWKFAQEYQDFEGICFYSWENGYYDTWGIALESFMREDLSYTADQFERAGEEYAGTYYREDLLKHFQQVCRELILNNEHKPHYYLDGEFIAWK
ncbi:MAG TPA: hypothetical protein PKX91_05900 [Clostridia bacterium]|jgi:hypothetical protein|nr:hypothetical protein [Clostridia bacterium]